MKIVGVASKTKLDYTVIAGKEFMLWTNLERLFMYDD